MAWQREGATVAFDFAEGHTLTAVLTSVGSESRARTRSPTAKPLLDQGLHVCEREIRSFGYSQAAQSAAPARRFIFVT